ncbi:uncharacterized protein KQ657_004289 [Scheffersomyces spartinae]|uniref:Protein IVY1 n=1 Tax=Scheffersomyces spartinae TaxID=45513 RepID=A0A9P7VB90_9ASCO|nr:uncharacterized protein KQ657_004289 [Scheffersomyces spartinae]KAG7194613.1 hypothetical protein KQ657_004289 [Scheffersomyces spartinae]
MDKSQFSTSTKEPPISKYVNLSHINNSGSRPDPPIPSTSSMLTSSREPSINTFTSFLPSVLDLPAIITEKDFGHTTQTYSNMLHKAATLLKALDQLSGAYAEFGSALESTVRECPKLHHLGAFSEGLVNAGGLQYLVGIVLQISGRVLRESFEEPLRDSLGQLQEYYTHHRADYQTQVKEKSQTLRAMELENVKLLKLKTRNISTYKNNLVSLTNQLDDLDRLKYEYYREVNEMIERFNNEQLLVKCGSFVRAQLELHESIAKKGWTGGGLEGLLNLSPDLFEVKASYSESDGINHDNEQRNYDQDEDVDVDEVDDDDDGGADISVRTITGIPSTDSFHNPTDSIRGQSLVINDTSTPTSGPKGDDEINTSTTADESFSLPIVNPTTNPLLRPLDGV